MIHSFYNKENGKFILKKKLMETFLNTENQNFLVWKYHKEKYAKEGVIVSRIFNLDNNSLTDRVNQTRSEFNLFRVRNKYPTNNQFKSSNAETAYIGVGLDACGYPQCGENGNGQCDGGWYCADNGDCPPCEDCEVKTMSVEQSLVSETVANALFDLDLVKNIATKNEWVDNVFNINLSLKSNISDIVKDLEKIKLENNEKLRIETEARKKEFEKKKEILLEKKNKQASNSGSTLEDK